MHHTPEFLSNKHVNFGQGLEFLKFGQGNRGPNQQNQRKTTENIRTAEGNRRKFDKKFRDRDPYFLFKNFLFDMFSVEVSRKILEMSTNVLEICGGGEALTWHSV